jgi:large subunit ribosomal protein L24e
MARCSFCEETIKSGTGLMYVKSEGKVLFFCGRKCEKNMIKLGRKAVKLKWTRASRKKRKAAHKEA